MEQSLKDELKKLIASGAISGAILGGGGSLLSGAKSLGAVGKAAALGAGLSGGLAGLSGSIGLGAMGSPEEEESSGYSKRLGIGGAVAGGLAGAGLGALLGASKKGSLLGKGARYAKAGVLNALGRGAAAKALDKIGSKTTGAIVGGLGLGALGAHQGVEEGMQMDFLSNLSKEQKEKLFRQRMMGEV
jgi:hypothetical protein